MNPEAYGAPGRAREAVDFLMVATIEHRCQIARPLIRDYGMTVHQNADRERHTETTFESDDS